MLFLVVFIGFHEVFVVFIFLETLLYVPLLSLIVGPSSLILLSFLLPIIVLRLVAEVLTGLTARSENQAIILLSQVVIAQDRVSFCDLLEFLLDFTV